MSKNESTAINDLIHLVQGKIIDHGSSDENLFVTAPPRAAGPEPLPRRRAPNATPASFPVENHIDDDDAATQIDPHAMARFAVGSAPQALPAPQPVMPQPVMPRPIVPQYALPTPAPLPPTPYRAPTAPVYAVPSPRPAPRLSISGFDQAMETVRVSPLHAPSLPGHRPHGLGALARGALPFGAAAIAVGCITGYLFHRGTAPAEAHEAPPEVAVVMAVSAPPSQAAAAAVEPDPVVTPASSVSAAITAEVPPTVTSTGEAIGWKPTAVQPTIAPKPVEPPAAVAAAAPPVAAAAPTVAAAATAVAAEPPAAAVVEPPAAEATEAEAEIEMEATAVVKHRHRAHKASSPPAIERLARPESKATAAPVRGRAADPVALALAEPARSNAAPRPTGTGPGKVTITSTPSALIYVDGRSTNMMTPKTLPLSAGTHKITLLDVSTRKAKTAEVDVPAGGSAQVAKKF